MTMAYQIVTTVFLLVLTLAACWIVYSLRELVSAVRLLFRPPADPETSDEDDELDEAPQDAGIVEDERGHAMAPNQKPLPVDPQHPPYTAVYRPDSGTLAPVCNCHQPPRQVKVGQKVMMWPVPGTGAREFWVFCEDAAS